MIITSKDLDNNVFYTCGSEAGTAKFTIIDFEYFKGKTRTTISYHFNSYPKPDGSQKWSLVRLALNKDKMRGEESNYVSVYNYMGKGEVRSHANKGRFSDTEFSLNEFAILSEFDRIRRQLEESNYVSLQLLKPEHMSYRAYED